MPVQRFRTFEEARRALWLEPDDPLILERMRHLGQMAMTRRAVRRGVTRVRRIEEAKAGKGAASQAGPAG